MKAMLRDKIGTLLMILPALCLSILAVGCVSLADGRDETKDRSQAVSTTQNDKRVLQTRWIYRNSRHRSTRARRKGQEPILPIRENTETIERKAGAFASSECQRRDGNQPKPENS